MSTFPGSPKLIKGALVAIDPLNPPGSVVVFQYNPDTMTRRLEARAAGGGDNADRSEALRVIGPPKETISLTIEIDAADGLETQNPLTIASGIYPTLAALEIMLYPRLATVIANVALAQAGVIEVVPPDGPLTVLVWGPQRVVPVRLTGCNITEEAYDPMLNPIRGKAELTMQVLSYYDLPLTNAGYSLFLAHQAAKEALAASNQANGVVNLGVTLKL